LIDVYRLTTNLRRFDKVNDQEEEDWDMSRFAPPEHLTFVLRDASPGSFQVARK
jgi:hypothetical protein